VIEGVGGDKAASIAHISIAHLADHVDGVNFRLQPTRAVNTMIEQPAIGIEPQTQ
jgi:hypothetical protein